MFQYVYDDVVLPSSSCFVGGMTPQLQTLVNAIGITNTLGAVNAKTERMRIIISKDPALRDMRSPAEVTSVLDKYGIVNASHWEAGMVLLVRMGFEPSIVKQLLDCRFHDNDLIIEDNLTGALTDDAINLVDIMSIEKLRTLSVPQSVNASLRYQI